MKSTETKDTYSPSTFKTVTSRDGTRIAYDQAGQGPVVILVAGALGVRAHESSRDLAVALTPHFTVYNYDRRGRGDSGDTAPYAVEREIEDIEALIDAAGGKAHLYGMSSGAVLALEAARQLPGKVSKVVLYEPPIVTDNSRPPVPADYVQQLNAAVAAGRRGDAVEIFMTKAIGIPAEFVAQMRGAPNSEFAGEGNGATPPAWAEMEKVAHTLAYDGMIMGDTMSGKPLQVSKWAGVSVPTLVVTGGNSEAFFHTTGRALADAIPRAQHRILEGQDHAVDPKALAPVLIEFYRD